MEFGNVGFCGEGETRVPEEKVSKQRTEPTTNLSPVLTYDTRIIMSISLYTSEDGCDISISVSIRISNLRVLLMFMLTLMSLLFLVRTWLA